MTRSVIIVDLITQDTVATVVTPHPYMNQDQNIFLIDAGTDFYIGVGYATGGIRSSLLKMNKATYQVETVFHIEGFAFDPNPFGPHPVITADRIYLGTFDSYYSITEDSLYVGNTVVPVPMAYDQLSATLFLYYYNSHFGINYFTNGIFSDTLSIPWYLSRAIFVPPANDTINSIILPDNKQLLVYPNPALDFIHIEMPENKEIEQVQFFDVTGKMIEKRRLEIFDNKFSLDIGYLPDGFYFMKIYTEGEIYSALFVKG